MLIEAETVPGVVPPFLRFHPTLAPVLWANLTEGEQVELTAVHRRRYYLMANYLYREDNRNPHQARAIARRELPNLLHAVNRALDAHDPEAVDFTDSINRLLNNFGLTREAARLTNRAEEVGGLRGSKTWWLVQLNRGEQLQTSGRNSQAAEVFADVLDALRDQPSYEHAVALAHLGRCYLSGARPDIAEAAFRQGLAIAEQLEPTDSIERFFGNIFTDLGNALLDQGEYVKARAMYELGLQKYKELGDPHGQGVSLGQLGTLAKIERDPDQAVRRYERALELFQGLGEPSMAAVAQHQLGLTFQKAGQWERAEQHYRESARLEEQCDNVAGAAKTWHQLAIGNEQAGKPEVAESWYRKAIAGFQSVGDKTGPAGCLNSLADLLREQPNRLAEARELAEEALAIKKTLDGGAAAIWKTYSILAQIALQQQQPGKAADYQRLAREAKREFAGTAHEMKLYLPIILGTFAAIRNDGTSDEFLAALSRMEANGWTKLVASIRRILLGERDDQALCADLDTDESSIVDRILRAVADPETLSYLLPPKDAE